MTLVIQACVSVAQARTIITHLNMYHDDLLSLGRWTLMAKRIKLAAFLHKKIPGGGYTRARSIIESVELLISAGEWDQLNVELLTTYVVNAAESAA